MSIFPAKDASGDFADDSIVHNEVVIGSWLNQPFDAVPLAAFFVTTREPTALETAVSRSVKRRIPPTNDEEEDLQLAIALSESMKDTPSVSPPAHLVSGATPVALTNDPEDLTNDTPSAMQELTRGQKERLRRDKIAAFRATRYDHASWRRGRTTIPDAASDVSPSDAASSSLYHPTTAGRMTLLEKMRADFHTSTGLVKRTYANMLPTLDFVGVRGDGWCLMHALQQALSPQSSVRVSLEPGKYIRAINEYTNAKWHTQDQRDMLVASFKQDLSNLREERSENFSQAICAVLAEMYGINIFLMGYQVTSEDDMWSLIGKKLQRMRDRIPQSGDSLKAALVDMLFDWGKTEWTIDSLITELIRDPTRINGLTDRRIAVFDPIRYTPHEQNATHTAILIMAGTGGHFDAIRVPEGARLETLLLQITKVSRMIIDQQAMLRQ